VGEHRRRAGASAGVNLPAGGQGCGWRWLGHCSEGAPAGQWVTAPKRKIAIVGDANRFTQ
jgi:hypothetical protein